ncbi:hypothetical protein JAAARDRAFT_409489 [Jaapia argillacea MUCL 33604]|uniref:Uncharacterized protein n=1 Tax=Jaapia argillacea MUCL 33604 TaxID=933084 RepID=A0A067PRX3_9AGAM|nr:hypothetical protein JAAARDRAFT_409489 [Jaapia argillacea MUCL 33604]
MSCAGIADSPGLRRASLVSESSLPGVIHSIKYAIICLRVLLISQYTTVYVLRAQDARRGELFTQRM